MAQSIVLIEAHVDGPAPADLAKRVAVPAAKPREEVHALQSFFGALGQSNARLSVRVDSAAGVAASRTLTITGASVTTGEWIGFVTPNGVYRITAVTSGAVAGDGTFNASGTDNTAATNIRAAINTRAGLKDWVTASGGTNSVVITANRAGIAGNSIVITDGTGGGIGTVGALTGGIEPTARITAAIGCVLANTDADDTVTIGKVAFIAKASGASGNEEFNLGGSNTIMADNLVAKINAHPDLLGIVSGVAASGTITLTYACDPRAALNIRLATSDADGLVITQPSTTLTLANAQATRTYALGAAA